MAETLRIVIPTAGWATRMRPQTWSKPKPLVSVAGRAVLDHLLASFASLPPALEREFVFIVGPHLGETQIPPYVREHHRGLKAHFVLQPEMKGQSDALWLAREHLNGPLLICFSDTLIETDFSFLTHEPLDGVAWVKPVPDPRRFGVAEVDASGRITRLIEKPQDVSNNLVVVGCYYFRDGAALISAIEEQKQRGTTLKGEYFLTDAINILLERGARMRTQSVEVWLDTGTVPATLETNRYLLAHGRDNSAEAARRPGLVITPPVFVHPEAQISGSRLGPHVSIGPGCVIQDSDISDSIVESGARIESASLTGSFIGRDAQVTGRGADAPPARLNIGDSSSVTLA